MPTHIRESTEEACCRIWYLGTPEALHCTLIIIMNENDLPKNAYAVLEKYKNNESVVLVKDRIVEEDGCAHQVKVARHWHAVVEDHQLKSYAFSLLRKDNPTLFSQEQLNAWFNQLVPSRFPDDESAWSRAYHEGKLLLRRTSWVTLIPGCECAYGYSDTWQHCASNKTFLSIIYEMTKSIEVTLGLPTGELNSVNLNWYPAGGGVGFHADDEYLFQGQKQDLLIVSLSLCENGGLGGLGTRRFQLKARESVSDQVFQIDLSHGDLLTMEGLCQLFYLHSVWPGDSTEFENHPLAKGERINLTWRKITRHLDGSEECKKRQCPLLS